MQQELIYSFCRQTALQLQTLQSADYSPYVTSKLYYVCSSYVTYRKSFAHNNNDQPWVRLKVKGQGQMMLLNVNKMLIIIDHP